MSLSKEISWRSGAHSITLLILSFFPNGRVNGKIMLTRVDFTRVSLRLEFYALGPSSACKCVRLPLICVWNCPTESGELSEPMTSRKRRHIYQNIICLLSREVLKTQLLYLEDLNVWDSEIIIICKIYSNIISSSFEVIIFLMYMYSTYSFYTISMDKKADNYFKCNALSPFVKFEWTKRQTKCLQLLISKEQNNKLKVCV